MSIAPIVGPDIQQWSVVFLKSIDIEQSGWHPAQSGCSGTALCVDEPVQCLVRCGHLRAFGGSESGCGLLLGYPVPSDPPSEMPGSSALSPALISEKPFGKTKGPRCLKQRSGAGYLVPEGTGDSPCGVGCYEPRKTDAGRFPPQAAGSPWCCPFQTTTSHRFSLWGWGREGLSDALTAYRLHQKLNQLGGVKDRCALSLNWE